MLLRHPKKVESKTLSFLFRATQTCLFSIVPYPADFWIPSPIYQPQPKKSRGTKSFFPSISRWSMQKDFNLSLLSFLLFSLLMQRYIFLLFLYNFYLFSIFSNLLQLSSRYLFREVGSTTLTIWSHISD